MGYSGKNKRESKHSPEGEKYRQLGEKEYERQHGEKLKKIRRQKRIDALGRPETKVQKEARTRMPSSSGGGREFPSIQEWCKQQGRSMTQRATIDYSKAKRRHQGTK